MIYSLYFGTFLCTFFALVSAVYNTRKVLRLGSVLPFTDDVANTVYSKGPEAAVVLMMALKEVREELKNDNVTIKYFSRDSMSRFGKSAESTVELATLKDTYEVKLNK
jgi:hypothetical protein